MRRLCVLLVALCGVAAAEETPVWGQSGAVPAPIADSHGRAGTWWHPKAPTSNAEDRTVWGNRGVLFGAVQREPIPEPQEIPYVESPIISCGGPVLNNILFQFDQANLSPQAVLITNEVVGLMNQYATDTVLVEGHTCDTGSAEYNLALGLRRAQAVADYLVEQGIDRSRVGVKSYGETQPAVPNDTEQNRALNRRAVFQFTLGK